MMNNRFDNQEKEFEEKLVQVNRVSKKTKGGNRVGFSALVVVGDKKGKVGIGMGKAADVSSAMKKAVVYAQKSMMTVPMRGTTIPHEIRIKLGAAKIILKPAPAGSGVIAGGSVRAVMEVAGVKDVVGKILGTSNKINNVKAVFEALRRLKKNK